jgi:hypothetical protein
MSKLYPSISGLSILMALALALGEWYFFFYGGPGNRLQANEATRQQA